MQGRDKMKVRTRYAPSPTGFMHIGNLRTAIFEYLLARKYDGDFILRIEDTDQTREVPGAIDFIYDTLKLCNFKIDEGPNNPGNYGPYIQSERKDIYKKYALELIEKGKAYYCFCTEEELQKDRELCEKQGRPYSYDGKCSRLLKSEIEEKLNSGIPYVIRQKMPRYGITEVNDLLYGKIKIDNSLLEDQILLKSDGYPTYNFANVIDDHLMEITHVVRGKEYLDQTAKYNLLYEAFGWKKPTYIHVAMVLGEDGNKLSKRNGDASFMDLYNDGYLPSAIVNYLAFLGWSPETNQEIFTMEELIKEFNPERISKSSSQYDVKKLRWINSHYIKNLSIDELYELTFKHLNEAYDLSDKSLEWVKDLVSLYQGELKYGKEIVDLVSLFFNEYSISEDAKEFMDSNDVSNTIKVFYDEVKDIDWTIDNISTAINNTKEKANVKGKMLYMPIRIKSTGIMHGPELDKTLYLLGKDKVLNNLTK